VHPVCVWHRRGSRGRPHRRARRSRTSCILSNRAQGWPHRGARHAPTPCILSVRGIAAELMEGLIVENATHNPQASCLLLSGGGLSEKHATHQLGASCLCVASSGVLWKASSHSTPLTNCMHPVQSCLEVASSRSTPSTNCVHPVCLRHRRGVHGRPHRRARRAGIPSIVSNSVCWWPHREARHAPAACILSVCVALSGSS
jgi:hypothetical protein